MRRLPRETEYGPADLVKLRFAPRSFLIVSIRGPQSAYAAGASAEATVAATACTLRSISERLRVFSLRLVALAQ
mgnify:CR=1 FL=1